MRLRFFIIFVFLISFVNAAAGNESIIFLHHSTGWGVYNTGNVEGYFDNYNSQEGTTYQITERDYPDTPYPWANYPYDYWNLWINGACDSSNPNIECLDTLVNDYDVIIWKHCFPGAAISADTGNPDITSSSKRIENYKLQYRALRQLMDSYPDTTFIIWTLAPLHRLATNSEHATRANEFSEWVKNDFLTEDGEHPNIFIFDFYGNASELDPNPPQGMQYTLKYEYEINHTSSNSHPNTLANQNIGPVFAQFIIDVIESKENSSICSSGADGNIDDVVSISELINFISAWKSGGVSISDLIIGISEWKNGC